MTFIETWTRRVLVGTVAAFLLVACAPIARTSEPASHDVTTAIPSGAVEIPTASTPPGLDSCAGIGEAQPLTLNGSPNAHPAVWMDTANGRASLVWPSGYFAIFDPGLRVMDPTGHVVARQGDDLRSLVIPGAVVCVSSRGGRIFTLGADT